MDVFGAGYTPLDRALAYPYPRLPGSFVLVGEKAYLYAEVGPDPLRTGSIGLDLSPLVLFIGIMVLRRIFGC